MAAVLVGYTVILGTTPEGEPIRLLNESVLNGTVVMILVTCIIASFATQKGAQEAVVVDPSAASFLEVLRREGWHVRKADNEVLSGIRQTADALKQGKIVICPPCTDAIREFASYCWDLSAGDRDRVRKEFDHAMDEIRYFVATVVAPEEGEDLFFAGYVERHV